MIWVTPFILTCFATTEVCDFRAAASAVALLFFHLEAYMAYCKNCGKEISASDKFCRYCGTSTSDSGTSDTRKNKCKYCGIPLDPFKIKCPACGNTTGKSTSSEATKKLTSRLAEIDARTLPKAEHDTSFIESIFGKSKSKKEREHEEDEERLEAFQEEKIKQKAEEITSFIVPNTKEDIIEFLILSNSQAKISDGKEKKAWSSKFNEVYSKAEILLQEDADFNRLKNEFQKDKKARNAKKIKITSAISFSSIMFVLIIGLLISFLVINNTNKKKEEEEAIALGKIKLELYQEDFEKKDFEEMKSLLEAKGFTNVKGDPIKDLNIFSAIITPDGRIEEVLVDGSLSFSSSDYYFKDVEIIIRYHTFKDD